MNSCVNIRKLRARRLVILLLNRLINVGVFLVNRFIFLFLFFPSVTWPLFLSLSLCLVFSPNRSPLIWHGTRRPFWQMYKCHTFCLHSRGAQALMLRELIKPNIVVLIHYGRAAHTFFFVLYAVRSTVITAFHYFFLNISVHPHTWFWKLRRNGIAAIVKWRNTGVRSNARACNGIQ